MILMRMRTRGVTLFSGVLQISIYDYEDSDGSENEGCVERRKRQCCEKVQLASSSQGSGLLLSHVLVIVNQYSMEYRVCPSCISPVTEEEIRDSSLRTSPENTESFGWRGSLHRRIR